MKFVYYIKNLSLNLVPQSYFLAKKARLEKKYQDRTDEIQSRVDYYCKLDAPFPVKDDFIEIGKFKRKGLSAYFYDLKEILYYFNRKLKFKRHFGDETHIEESPTLFKARPIAGDNANSVIMKLDKYRHFKFVNDSIPFTEKKDNAVFRGAVYRQHRIDFMERMFGHPLVDAGQSNSSDTHPEWQKPFMSKEEQLQSKFILCLEGNDVATNLKWAMSSNSVVITPPMKYETWFMEGTLVAGVHFVEVKADYSDLAEKIEYYAANPDKAQTIIDNAQQYVAQFLDPELEELISIKVLEKYFTLSGQL